MNNVEKSIQDQWLIYKIVKNYLQNTPTFSMREFFRVSGGLDRTSITEFIKNQNKFSSKSILTNFYQSKKHREQEIGKNK